MNQGDGSDGVRRWRLTGVRAVLHWASIAAVPVILTFGLTAILSAREGPPLWFVALWIGAGAYVLVQFLRLATTLEFDAAGTLHVRRPLLPDVSVRADQVRRLGLGPIARRVGIGGGNLPRYVDYQADGRTRRVPVASGLPGLFELGTALRERQPDVVVELG